MFKKKGIVLKTFVFTSLLITTIVIISFGILYFALPDYYLYTKNRNLQERANELAIKIKDTEIEDELTKLISDFSLNNNAEVLSFNTEDQLVPSLSSPFLSMNAVTKNAKRLTVAILARTSEESTGDNSLDNQVFITKDALLTNQKKIAIKADTFRYELKTTDSSDISHVEITREVGNPMIQSIAIISTLQPIDEAKTVMISLIPYLLIIDILVALVAAYFYSKQLTKPIIQLSKTAARMKSLEPGISCEVGGNDEVGELSQNLDDLYRSLCSNIENVKHEMAKVSLLEKSKTDFMRAASHELKTPITALNGMVEGMIDNVGKYKDKETYLQESKRLIDHLTKLVNEILKASKFDTTENILHMENVQVSEIVEKILENNKVFIEEKELSIYLEKIDFQIYTDRIIIENTLSNIISNAVRYTEAKGKININFSETTDHIILSIENQCENIGANDLQKLFEPFYTKNYSRNRSKNGTGLGLYIVKKNLETLQIPYKLGNTHLGLKFNIYFTKAT